MRLGKLRMLLEDRDREVDDLRSLLSDREGRIQQLVQDLHQRHDGEEGGLSQHGRSALGVAEGSSAKGGTCCLSAADHIGSRASRGGGGVGGVGPCSP